MNDLITERSFESQDTYAIIVLGSFFDMLSKGVCICTTTHWPTSGRLVEELNICTVAIIFQGFSRYEWMDDDQ